MTCKNSCRAEYGIDAPEVVKNLFLSSLCLFIAAIFSQLIENPFWFWIIFLYTFATSLVLFATGCWMLYGIKVAKPKIMSQMILNLRLAGNEKLLDLGCGRGVLLCEAAKQLPNGEVYGIDLWSSKDQSGNKLEETLKNARREGVENRVTVQTGDVRALPFPDAMFDGVVSSLCLHNISGREEREKALLEMLRVLKPGGKFAIADIQRAQEYTQFLRLQGANVSCSKPHYAYCPPIRVVEGVKS